MESTAQVLLRLRSYSCYKTLRFAINLSALCGLGVLISSFLIPIVAASDKLADADLKFLILPALYTAAGCIGIIATRQMMLLFVDIADTLISEHARNRSL